MRSRQLHTALTEYLEAAGSHLRADLEDGAEVPFEVGSHVGRRGAGGTPLYCYRALTSEFIAEREGALKRVPGHAEAAKLLESFDGLDRYLASAGAEVARTRGHGRGRAAIRLLLEDVFQEQADFQVRPERVAAAIERLESSASAGPNQLALVATLHGLTISSAEIHLAKGLVVAHPQAIEGVPQPALAPVAAGGDASHLLVVFTVEELDLFAGVQRGREQLAELLRALRLFGDGRVTLGAIGWARIAASAWTPVPVGTGGRPHGMLVVTVEQEDELRAFCNLIARRTPGSGEVAWALRRFELGCERDTPREALTDDLLGLRALLEPEGPASGLLAGRVAALCATPETRAELTERVADAVALERSLIAGASVKQATVRALERELSAHLRALLSDVVCGHLDPDLAALADELLMAPAEADDEGVDSDDELADAGEAPEEANEVHDEAPEAHEEPSGTADAEQLSLDPGEAADEVRESSHADPDELGDGEEPDGEEPACEEPAGEDPVDAGQPVAADEPKPAKKRASKTA
jgi:hypothetical protein